MTTRPAAQPHGETSSLGDRNFQAESSTAIHRLYFVDSVDAVLAGEIMPSALTRDRKTVRFTRPQRFISVGSGPHRQHVARRE